MWFEIMKGVPTFRALALSDTSEVRTMSRVPPLLFLLASLVASRPARAAQPDFRLQVVPAIVYKVDDPGNTETSTFVFDVAVICSTDSALTPISASVQLSDGHSIVERQ